MALYKIQITPIGKTQEPYIFKVETPDIEWTMDQYQRNREPLEWKIMDWDIQV